MCAVRVNKTESNEIINAPIVPMQSGRVYGTRLELRVWCFCFGIVEEKWKSLHRSVFIRSFRYGHRPDWLAEWKLKALMKNRRQSWTLVVVKMWLLLSIIHAMGDQKKDKFDFFGSLVAAAAAILVPITTIACAFSKSTQCVIFYPLTCVAHALQIISGHNSMAWVLVGDCCAGRVLEELEHKRW